MNWCLIMTIVMFFITLVLIAEFYFKDNYFSYKRKQWNESTFVSFIYWALMFAADTQLLPCLEISTIAKEVIAGIIGIWIFIIFIYQDYLWIKEMNGKTKEDFFDRFFCTTNKCLYVINGVSLWMAAMSIWYRYKLESDVYMKGEFLWIGIWYWL